MGRRAEEPLEKKDIILFKGDWEALRVILAPRKITPTVFIRALVRKKLREIEAKTNLLAQPGPELKDDDLELGDLAAAQSVDGGQGGEPE